MYNYDKLKPIGECKMKLYNPRCKKHHICNFLEVHQNVTPIIGKKTSGEMGLININYHTFENKVQTTRSKYMDAEDITIRPLRKEQLYSLNNLVKPKRNIRRFYRNYSHLQPINVQKALFVEVSQKPHRKPMRIKMEEKSRLKRELTNMEEKVCPKRESQTESFKSRVFHQAKSTTQSRRHHTRHRITTCHQTQIPNKTKCHHVASPQRSRGPFH
jgi:hypothetical protein